MATTKINSIGVTQLTLASHAQFHQEISLLVQSITPEKLHLEALAAPYEAAIATEMEVVNRPTAYAETGEMQAADHERDLTLSLCFNLVDAYAASPDGDEQSAAHTLATLLLPYRSIQSHEMHRETTEVDGLIAALDAPAAIDALKALHIEDMAERLDTVNSRFRALEARRDAEALRRQPVSEAHSKLLRQQTDELYHRIADTTNAYCMIQPTDDLANFAARANVIVAKYKNVIANQGKTKKKTAGE